MNPPAETKPPRRKRRVLRVAGISLAVVAGGLGLLAATFSPSWILTPRTPFDPEATPAAPDYGSDEAWAALPSLEDHADFVPEGLEPAGEQAPVDVFFVHPTTYFSKASWNAAVDEPVSSELLEQVVLASEASPFNGCCRVFAPRYRQATLGSFYADPPDAEQAFAVAYGDVEAAFDAFQARIGDRPFIVAGHSQGSMHLMRLLERVDGDEALRGRLVAAYIPGMAVPRDQYGGVWKHLAPCEAPGQTGCVAAWDTYREGAKVGGTGPLFHWRGDELVKVPVDAPRQCTNPVAWTDGGAAQASAHLGAVAPAHRDAPPSFITLLMASDPIGMEVLGLEPHPDVQVAARCEDSVLRVPDLGELGFPEQETEPGNYHLHDYELFHANVRANASARVAAYLAARGT